jgi:hypothetical protein
LAKHVHIHIHRGPTKDAGTAHDPSNGQFTSGSNGGSGMVVKHQPSGTTVPHQAPKKLGGHESMASTHARRGNAIREAGTNGNAEKTKLMTQHFAAAKAHTAAAAAEKSKHPDYERLAAAAHGASRKTQR